MKVTMNVSISGTRDGADWPPAGEQVELPKDEAEALVAAGLASTEAPPSKASPEKATAKKAETRKS